MDKIESPSQKNLKKGDIRIRFYGLVENLVHINSCLTRMGIITNVEEGGYDVGEAVLIKNQSYKSKEPLLFLRSNDGKLETIAASEPFNEKFSSFLSEEHKYFF